MKELIIIASALLAIGVFGFVIHKLYGKKKPKEDEPDTKDQQPQPKPEKKARRTIDTSICQRDPKYRMACEMVKTEFELDMMALQTAQKMLKLERRGGLYR